MDEKKKRSLKLAQIHTKLAQEDIAKMSGFDISRIPNKLKHPIDTIFVHLGVIEAALKSVEEPPEQIEGTTLSD